MRVSRSAGSEQSGFHRREWKHCCAGQRGTRAEEFTTLDYKKAIALLKLTSRALFNLDCAVRFREISETLDSTGANEDC